MNIFVGNLLFEATEGDVKKLFEGFGEVASVVIAMKKRRASKSRGFGFVQMPDEQQALAAIAALNGKEFMGRPLNVNPARPETEVKAKIELRRPGTYGGGRRTRSYFRRLGLTGMQGEAKPWQKSRENPMRWRKKKGQAKPWQKSPGERKPWKKAEGEARPWKKAEGEFKPWRKSGDGDKPRKKTKGHAKPWSRSSEHPQKSRFKGRRKPGGYKR